MTTYEPYAKIAEEIKDLDIAMLYLNAGVTGYGPLEIMEPKEIQDIVTVNSLHPIYLGKALLSQIKSRKARSAIVLTSSGAAVRPLAGLLPYCSSKVFASYFARALHWELKDCADVLAWEPGETST
mmetsp:Transcript_20554/g.14797  ORF Transcript_20554/g.14797 Transcript_20554/m.14797 type:complete len:126 (+) Transcript_20554:414-791(+)|eukprot:CAMPEP_0116881498 /NCGR_PEP_ID=MMETSP0463-20121206/13604_1 /TAXON_ID=181622 /ORGANISM="Strombidinopsis sp, Strain SopsisLIS2011" /LENGTH=125 /DNA_ID=CAMNT_0004533491 /DNA_START=407 /DNA_END=784 /DNA_ORIENTATION=-